jgi:hypothetical protein
MLCSRAIGKFKATLRPQNVAAPPVPQSNRDRSANRSVFISGSQEGCKSGRAKAGAGKNELCVVALYIAPPHGRVKSPKRFGMWQIA